MINTMQLSRAYGNHALSLRLATVTVGLLILTACASVPKPPTAELQAAEMAIANAERSRVADYASAELSLARDKLTAARSEAQKENMVQAKRLAEQARVDADLASARADVAKAEVVNNEMRKSTEMLKQEMQRTRGDRP